MKFILGKKLEMTQKFSPDGKVIPVTKILAGPCLVTQVKSAEKEGYLGVQLGFGKRKKINKPQAGHLKGLDNFEFLREFRIKEKTNLKRGDKITASIFNIGDKIQVSGISKGKGFQGVVKRWGFSGSPATHGHKDQLRMPGSIGVSGVQRVFKGKKMPGRLGGGQVTVKNLEVIEVEVTNNLIFVKGAIPGAKNNLVLLAGAGELILPVETKSTAKEEKVSKNSNK